MRNMLQLSLKFLVLTRLLWMVYPSIEVISIFGETLEVQYNVSLKSGDYVCVSGFSSGMVVSVQVNLNYKNGSPNYLSSQFFVGINYVESEIGDCIQLGGAVEKCNNIYSWPPTWNANADGTYTATIDVSSASYSFSSGYYSVCVGNGDQEDNVNHSEFFGKISLVGLETSSSSTDNDNNNKNIFNSTVIIIGTVPIGIILSCVVLFYFANKSSTEQREKDIDTINRITKTRKGKLKKVNPSKTKTNTRRMSREVGGVVGEGGEEGRRKKSFVESQHSNAIAKKCDLKDQLLVDHLISSSSSNPDYNDYHADSGNRGRSGTEDSSNTLRDSLGSKSHPQDRASLVESVRSSFTDVMRNTFVWEQEEDFVFTSRFEWSPPWEASLKRKIFWYIFGYSFVGGMIMFAVVLYGNPITDEDGLLPWRSLKEWTSIDILTFFMVSIVTTGVYFLPLIFMPHDIANGKNYINDKNFLKRIGVVIPCHKSALEIGDVLKQVLKYIPASHIVVCDNGNFAWPADNTFEVVKRIHPDIQYCFIAQGHKTRALWTGAHRLPPQCKYVMHLDDDTLLSDYMVFDESHFLTEGGDHVNAVAFLRSSEKINRLTKFTDFWYKITDHYHATQARICTRAFVPGPAGLWRRDRFIQVFGAHPALPFGEDIFGGFTTLNQGNAIRTENRCMVTTFAPPILFTWPWGGTGRVQGYGASSLWKQRAHRWTVSALRITGKSLYSFFTYDTKLGLLSNIAFRLYRFREYKIILVQVSYIPFCIILLSRGYYVEFLLVKLLLFILPFLRNIYINYICWYHQPELQVDFETVCLSPLYNFFLIMCAVHGRLKCLLWYLPEVPPNHGMLQRCIPDSVELIRERSFMISSTGSYSSKVRLDTNSIQSSLMDDSVPPMCNSSPMAKSVHGLYVSAASISRSTSNVSTRNGEVIDAYLERSIDPKSTDAFEFFCRDGTSTFVSYSRGNLDDDDSDEDEETETGVNGNVENYEDNVNAVNGADHSGSVFVSIN